MLHGLLLTLGAAFAHTLGMLWVLGGSPGPAGPPGPPGPPGSGTTVFVFDPGAVGPGGSNVFATQAALNAAVAASVGNVTVQVRGTATLAAASWRAVGTREVTIAGTNNRGASAGAGGVAVLTITGPIVGVCGFAGGLLATYTNAADFDVTTLGQEEPEILIGDGVTLATGGAGFWYAPASVAPFSAFILSLAADVAIGPGANLARASASGFVLTYVQDGAIIGSNCLAGPGASHILNVSPSGSVSATQTGITGTLLQQYAAATQINQSPQVMPGATATVQEALAQAAGQLQRAVYAPGSASTLRDVYTDMLALVADYAALAGRRLVEISAHLGAPHLLAGSYAFGNWSANTASDVELRGAQAATPLAIDDGATATGLDSFTDLVITYAGIATHAFASQGGGAPPNYRFKGTSVTSSGAGSFLKLVVAPGSSVTYLEEGSQFLSGVCWEGASASSFTLVVDGTSNIAGSTLKCASGAVVNVLLMPGGVCSANQPGVTGAGTLNIVPIEAAEVTAQGAVAAAASIFMFSVSHATKTGRCRVHFEGLLTLSSLGAHATCTILPGGGSLLDGGTFVSSDATLPGENVQVGGEDIITGLAVGVAAVLIRVQAVASAGTVAGVAGGAIVVQDID